MQFTRLLPFALVALCSIALPGPTHAAPPDIETLCPAYAGRPLFQVNGVEVAPNCEQIKGIGAVMASQPNAFAPMRPMIRALQSTTWEQVKREKLPPECRLEPRLPGLLCDLERMGMDVRVRMTFRDEGYFDEITVLIPDIVKVIQQVAAAKGTPERVPQLLPEGRNFLLDALLLHIEALLDPNESVRKTGTGGLELVIRRVQTG